MLGNRKISILFSVIEEHVRTAEPVASQAIVARQAIDASPATVRNDMVALEEHGYLAQPHPSAGRVPTERAYRLYIDHLQQRRCAIIAGVDTAIREVLAVEIDARAIGKAIARMLADVASQVIVVRFHRGDAYATGLSYLVVQPEFQDPEVLQEFSSAVDRLDETLDALDDLLNGSPRVILGSENPFGDRCGTVATRLALPAGYIMTLGIVGPMRMTYDRNLGIIETVRSSVSQAAYG